jgi:hypothetical protein
MSAAIAEADYRFPISFDETRLPPSRPSSQRPTEDDYRVPAQPIRRAPETVSQLRDIIRVSGLTDRAIADVLGVSHPTIGQVRRGADGALSRKDAARQRLYDAHRIMMRVAVLTGHAPDRVADVLSRRGRGGLSVLELIHDGRAAEAYLMAIEALRPQRPGEMMIGSHPLDPRTRTAAILSED